MRFGFHVSIAGGFSKVLERAAQRDCATIQVFSRNPRGWKYSPLDEEEVKIFRQDIEQTDIDPVFVHMPYLPNLASPNDSLHQRSTDSVAEELRRAEVLGAQYVITHVGSSVGKTIEAGIRQVTKAISRALDMVKNRVILLVENTSGSGSEVGSTLEEIRSIIGQVGFPERIGVAFDIAHAFEAGYDFRTQAAVDNTLAEFDRIVGFERLHLVHMNDSKSELGSRADRHWHIGEGKIGLEGFECLVNHAALKGLPGIMETPRKDTKEDLKNMKVIRGLVK